MDVDQAFIQSDVDTELFLRLPTGCGRLSNKAVRLNKAIYGLKQRGRSWYELLWSTLVECGFDQCLVDPCMFRLMVNDEVERCWRSTWMISRSQSPRKSRIRSRQISTKKSLRNILARLRGTWYMGSENKRDREKGTPGISQIQFIGNAVERFGVTKTSPIPASPSFYLRHVSDRILWWTRVTVKWWGV